jgi:hypothetical protein
MESLYIRHVIDRSSALEMAQDERLSANDLRTFLAFSVLDLDGGLDDALITKLAHTTALTPGIVRGCILALASFGYISFSTSQPAATGTAETIPPAPPPPPADMPGPRHKPARTRGLDPSLMEGKVDLARLKRIGDAAARDAAALRDARTAVSGGLAEFRPISDVSSRGGPPTPPETSVPREAPVPASGGFAGFRPVGGSVARAAPVPSETGNDVPGDRILRGLSDWNPVDGEAGQPAAVRFSVWLRFVLTPDELDSWGLWMAASPGERADWAGRYAKAKAAGEDKELLQMLRRRLNEIAKAPPIPGGPGSVPMGPAD